MAPVAARGMDLGRISRRLFALALGVYLFTAGGSLTTTDAVVAFDVARNIVEHHTVATSGNLLGSDAFRGLDGQYYSPFGIGQSLYDVPYYLAGRAIASRVAHGIGKRDTIPKAVVALGQAVIGAVIVVQIFRWSAAITGDAVSSALAAVTFAFGSVLWPYARFGFNQPLACAALLAAVAAACAGVRDGRRAPVAWAGWWFAIALLTRHELAVSVLPLAAYLWFAGGEPRRIRVSRLLAFAPGVVVGIATWLLYNVVRFGDAFDAGQLRDPTPRFGSPIAAGLAGLLFSPAASLFLYSPVVLFGLAGLVALVRRNRAATWLSVSIVVALVLVYASLGNWIGGRAYGSRYLVVVLPYFAAGWAALLASLRPARRRWLFAVVTVVGLVVQMPGVLVDYSKISETTAAANGGMTTEARQWDWRASAFALDARALPRAVADNAAYVLDLRPTPVVRAPASDADRTFARQFAFSLDFWWLYLFYLGVLSRATVCAVIAVFVAGIVVACRALRVALAPGPRSYAAPSSRAGGART